jgi:hypothetical protein
MAPVTDLPPEAAVLFRTEPAGFIASRDALVRDLREAGRDDDAATVKALRKPTVLVWALDQLAVRDPEGVADLLTAARDLRAAQQATLRSADAAGALRAAADARREVIGRLTAVAAQALGEVGTAGATRADAIAAALANASIDPDAGAALRAGTLREVPSEPAGFGDVFGLAAVPDPPRGAERSRSPEPDTAKLRRARDVAVETAAEDRGAADELARELAAARERVLALEVEHAAAEARALESEAAAGRAEKDLRSRSR